MTSLSAMRDTVRGWIPKRETIGDHRLLRPFAHHLMQPNLWHMNHRSVPRAVALGLTVGIVLPFLHVVIATLLAIPARANVAIAAGTTLIINPLTMPALYWVAYHIGSWEMLHMLGTAPPMATHPGGRVVGFESWLRHAGEPIMLGVLTLALIAGPLGYALTFFIWKRLRLARWRSRPAARA